MQENQIIIYQTDDGSTKIETRLQDETVWLTQAQLCNLFQKSKSSISEQVVPSLPFAKTSWGIL